MRIPRNLHDEIVAHARGDAPNECCGLMGGRDGAIASVHRAENLFASPLRFEVANPVKLLNAIEDAGEELAGIYHSHTKSEAYPSQTDVNLARGWPDPLWFICSLADPDEPVLRAFAIREGNVEEVELEVSD
jgi:[CysO sulfur-carrier protein]-S-L-cysteine hydrolase